MADEYVAKTEETTSAPVGMIDFRFERIQKPILTWSACGKDEIPARNGTIF